MAEVPTKPGRGAPPPPARNAAPVVPAIPPGGRNPDEDTLRLETGPASAAPVTSLAPAERYRLGAELGRGGMGRVVEAFDLQLGRTVALKEVLPKGGAGVARRFAREVQLTARLEHPSIVPLYDAGTTIDGRPFYVMRRVSGRPLDQLMIQAGELADRLTLLPSVLAAIDAVAHAHRRGVIHRDLKPANILVGELGETIVIDWGLAKVIGEDDDKPGTLIAQASDSLRTQMGSVFGTPGFMAPEQARGEELDPRGDVYALGATLYQLLAGAPPHAGTSATEVIAKTGTREVTPVSVVAPGAPPELVAIVGKALAFDAADRYADAGALGEDVRRFLAGQLVAAHRYTTRQRVTRFARRHRAPLAVAALAMLAVAVLAWVGVHRIVHERDAANTARGEADLARAIAERARDEAQHSANQLIVMQARGLLDKNPTHALAVLKELPDGATDRLGEARAVAQAAVVRGAAWSIATGDDLTIYAELSADARFLLGIGRDGVVRVWDLDHRRLVIARPYPPDTRVTWVGRAVLVTTTRKNAELLDPFAATIQEVPARIAYAVATATTIAYRDDHDAAYLMDVATRRVTPLWPGHKVAAIELAFDARWVAVADAQGVAVLDGAGAELGHHAGAIVRITGSRFGQVGFLAADRVLRFSLSGASGAGGLAGAVWDELDMKPWKTLALDAVFRGRQLDVYAGTGKVLAWDDRPPRERFAVSGLSWKMLAADRDLLVVPGNDGTLKLFDDLVTGELHLPAPLAALKVYAQPGSSRIVALGRGRIVGFELADSLPRTIARPPGTNATFVDDDTLLLWRTGGTTWEWYDLKTGSGTEFPYEPHGLASVMAVDPSDGRVLIHETANESALVLLRKGTPEVRRIIHGPAVWARLLPRGALIVGVGDGRVFAVRDGTPRELIKLDGIADNAVWLGGTRFAAVSSGGELVRGDYVSGALERAHVAPGTTGVIAADRAGRVLVAEDNRLLRWDRDVEELVTADQRIVRIAPTDDGVLLELADHAVVEARSGAVVQRIGPSNRPPLIGEDGKLVVGQSVNGQLAVFEAASRAGWDLPAYYEPQDLLSMAPTTRRFVQASYAGVALWTLPLAPQDLRPWLDERTDARTDGEHALTWPSHPALPRP
jgi:hypothetical protein